MATLLEMISPISVRLTAQVGGGNPSRDEVLKIAQDLLNAVKADGDNEPSDDEARFLSREYDDVMRAHQARGTSVPFTRAEYIATNRGRTR